MCKQTLADYSPNHKPWTMHKIQNSDVADIYAKTHAHKRKAARMMQCSGSLTFGYRTDKDTGEAKLKLLKAQFCRVRYCPICQWRRALMWRAKFYKAMPDILSAYPSARFIFLTLTIENCHIDYLRVYLKWMNEAWGRLVKRNVFKSVLGWVRATEVTRDKKRNGYAHPHFHCLLMVPASYFSHGYVRHDAWQRAWKECMRLDYDPVVDVRAVRRKLIMDKDVTDEKETLPHNGIMETLKYSTKYEDMTYDKDWFIELTERTHHLRFMATGGLFKNILKDVKDARDSEMVNITDAGTSEDFEKMMRFLWHDHDYYFHSAIEVTVPGSRGSAT